MKTNYFVKIKLFLLIEILLAFSQGKPPALSPTSPCKAQCIDIGNRYCSSLKNPQQSGSCCGPNYSNYISNTFVSCNDLNISKVFISLDQDNNGMLSWPEVSVQLKPFGA